MLTSNGSLADTSARAWPHSSAERLRGSLRKAAWTGLSFLMSLSGFFLTVESEDSSVSAIKYKYARLLLN